MTFGYIYISFKVKSFLHIKKFNMKKFLMFSFGYIFSLLFYVYSIAYSEKFWPFVYLGAFIFGLCYLFLFLSRYSKAPAAKMVLGCAMAHATLIFLQKFDLYDFGSLEPFL